MSLLQTIVAFVVALAILIVVHEYGHFLVARLCGVKVLRFSVGFGRILVSRRLGRDLTEWSLSAIPFGGYVKMLDEREGPVAEEERHRAFNRQSVWRRALIVAAGPAFNFAFAIAVYAGLFLWGVPESLPLIAEPPAKTLAAAADLRAGDRIRAIGDRPVATWQEVRWQMMQAALGRERVQLGIERTGGAARVVTLDLAGFSGDQIDAGVLETIGLRLYRPPLEPVLGEIVRGGAAERAGLQAGDRVRRIDDRDIATWEDLVAAVQARPGVQARFLVERGDLRLPVEVMLESAGSGDARIGRVGAGPQVPEGYGRETSITVRHSFLEALTRAVAKTWDISVFSLRMIGRILIGDVSWRHISGPVTIADIAGQTAQLGWLPYVTFLALISISLGVLNLLPVPLLDGGHLMYYAIEVVKGSPVSERTLEFGQRVGLTLLLLLMVFAFYNDFNRLVSG